MFNKTDEILLFVQISKDDSLIAGPKKRCCTNVAFMGKIRAISKRYALVRTKFVTTQLVLSFAEENKVDLNSVRRVR